MRRIFGTDGIRGVANVEPMTVEMALKIGRAVGYLFRNTYSKGKIVIGKDTRLSGYMFEAALVAGICSMGSDAILLGPFPTPGIGFITKDMRADAGIVISASHNPYQDNGIKVFTSEGLKLSDELEKELERLVFSGEIDHIRPTATHIGKAYRVEDALGRYVVYLKRTFPSHLSLEGIKIVIDCAHGATYKIAPIVFSELGAEVIVINNTPDGTNINRECGSVYPQAMAKKVLEKEAHLGVAFDGDGDRAIFSDEKGMLRDGDDILCICGVELSKRKRLKKNTLVATIMSNMGLELTLSMCGAKVVRTQVGDRYVFDTMQKEDYTLGGEPSGHLIFREFGSTGDGIITTLQVLAFMLEEGKSLAELSKNIIRIPQIKKDFRVSSRIPIEQIPELNKEIKKIEKVLDKKGRVVLRYSGTEPVLRVMLEGEDEDKLRTFMDEIVKLIERHLK